MICVPRLSLSDISLALAAFVITCVAMCNNPVVNASPVPCTADCRNVSENYSCGASIYFRYDYNTCTRCASEKNLCEDYNATKTSCFSGSMIKNWVVPYTKGSTVCECATGINHVEAYGSSESLDGYEVFWDLCVVE